MNKEEIKRIITAVIGIIVIVGLAIIFLPLLLFLVIVFGIIILSYYIYYRFFKKNKTVPKYNKTKRVNNVIMDAEYKEKK